MKRLLLLLTLTLILSACATDTTQDKHIENTQAPNADITKKKEIEADTLPTDIRLQLGEHAVIDNIEIIINNAEFIEDRIPDHFETFEYVMKLNVTYKNNSDTVFPAGRDITLTVNDETEATYYNMEGTLLEDVNPGESTTGDIYYAFNGQPERLTAKFEPILNTKGDHALFDVMSK
ncbi:hypothetical protein [Phocicoccus pinnipedialis]|uniref:DUF4352 domain-containing protein n=1 Tax=Phocicoccus pinnipedialis TaxID=110845 RepID=A0A6V7R8H9_9BACL|nr:hypothetical protein [Jeotgalicoccus pinnipedialis]MBP1938845.1 hypothetical protein [Jeotgalicoccus pinnipedialis]CAD2073324.1 hypothetical protein JEOPIN946_00699 [Jeotgalicoccus pinnipedialis]